MFILLAGSSGAGKNTIIKHLEKTDNRYKLMPTYTTREKREGEVEGYPYFYVTKDEFQNLIKNNELLEHEFIHNNFYGTSAKVVKEYMAQDKRLIKDIDVFGVQNLHKKLKDTVPVLKVFLTTKNKAELKKRLIGRGEKNIKLRLKRFKLEQKERVNFDFVILNNNIEKTCKIIDIAVDFDYLDVIPTIPYKKIKFSKVKKYISNLQSQKKLKPVILHLQDDKVYVISGHEQIIASIYTGIPVCNFVTDEATIKYQATAEDLTKWHQLILKQGI